MKIIEAVKDALRWLRRQKQTEPPPPLLRRNVDTVAQYQGTSKVAWCHEFNLQHRWIVPEKSAGSHYEHWRRHGNA